MKVLKALIPVGGLGTRFLPATKIVPKELLPIVDRPALEYVLEELADSGIREIVFVIAPGKEAILEHFSRSAPVERRLAKRNQSGRLKDLHRLMDRLRFRTAYQRQPRGLGHAVYCGRKQIGDEPFVVLLPDDLVQNAVPCTRQLLDVFEKECMTSVAVEKIPDERISSYGVVNGPGAESGNPFRVRQIVEKPSLEKAPSRWGIIGRYALLPDIFAELGRLKPGAIGEIQLTDALARMSETSGLLAVPFEGFRLDAGQPLGWIEANIAYALIRPDLASGLKARIAGLVGPH